MPKGRIDYVKQEKDKVLCDLKIVPGIYLLSDQDKDDYNAFVAREFSCKIKIEHCLQPHGGGGVYYTNNIQELRSELIKKSEYQQIQLKISESFLSRFKLEIKSLVQNSSQSFIYLTQEMQDKIVKETVVFYIKSLNDRERNVKKNKPQKIDGASFAEFLESFNLNQLILQTLTDPKKQIVQSIYSQAKKYISKAIMKHVFLAIFFSETEIEFYTESLFVLFINDIIKNKININNLERVIEDFIKTSLDILNTINSKKTENNFLYWLNNTEQNITLDKNLKNLLQRLKHSAYLKGLDAVKQVFEFCFLIPPTQSEIEFLVEVFAANTDFQKKFIDIKEFFENKHKEGQILIDNGYDLSLEKVKEDWLVAACRWFLGNKKVQEFGASQALLSKLGLLHNAPSSLVTEAGNVILIADNADMAGNVRKLFHSICLPLKPLAKEWFVILPSETNWLMIGWRLLLPILIASVVIVSGFILISLVDSMPAIFELLMIIPLAYFGFFAASMCIVARDYTYEKFMNYLYNGLYNRPEYKVNNALITAFGKDMASKIRDYYVSELRECDILIEEMDRRIQNKIVSTDDEKNYLLLNSGTRKDELLAEWSQLTMFRVNPPSKEELQNLIKRRIAIDSITQYDINKNERFTYIRAYIQSIADRSHHAFFQDKKSSISKSKHEYEKIQSLKEINSGLDRTLQIV